jgi:hypothetical protein
MSGLWRQLYAMVWLVFLQIVIIVVTISNFQSYLIYLIYGHVVLGLLILGLSYHNDIEMRRTQAPDRLKRIARATAVLATIQPIFGIILFLNVGLKVGIPFVWIITFLHLVVALAIITQASSLATAYDMWDEKEYTK